MEFDKTKIPDGTKYIHPLKAKDIIPAYATFEWSDIEEIKRVTWELILCCERNDTKGLAATQLGYRLPLFVIKATKNKYDQILQPTFDSNEQDKSVCLGGYESCLSLHKDVQVKSQLFWAMDRYFFTSIHNNVFETFCMVVGMERIRLWRHLHEHLQGKTFLDRTPDPETFKKMFDIPIT